MAFKLKQQSNFLAEINENCRPVVEFRGQRGVGGADVTCCHLQLFPASAFHLRAVVSKAFLPRVPSSAFPTKLANLHRRKCDRLFYTTRCMHTPGCIKKLWQYA